MSKSITFLTLSKNDKFLKSSQMKSTFGEYIKKLRKEKGFTLTQLAAKLNLDSANLSKIENNKREFDEKRLKKLAIIFSLDLNNLRDEYFGDQFAKKMYEYNCSKNALIVAEKKIRYLKQINQEQTKMNFENE